MLSVCGEFWQTPLFKANWCSTWVADTISQKSSNDVRVNRVTSVEWSKTMVRRRSILCFPGCGSVLRCRCWFLLMLFSEWVRNLNQPAALTIIILRHRYMSCTFRTPQAHMRYRTVLRLNFSHPKHRYQWEIRGRKHTSTYVLVSSLSPASV